MDTPHGKIIEENECSMLCDEELLLLSESLEEYFAWNSNRDLGSV
jgi:hypothetical protein